MPPGRFLALTDKGTSGIRIRHEHSLPTLRQTDKPGILAGTSRERQTKTFHGQRTRPQTTSPNASPETQVAEKEPLESRPRSGTRKRRPALQVFTGQTAIAPDSASLRCASRDGRKDQAGGQAIPRPSDKAAIQRREAAKKYLHRRRRKHARADRTAILEPTMPIRNPDSITLHYLQAPRQTKRLKRIPVNVSHPRPPTHPVHFSLQCGRPLPVNQNTIVHATSFP